MFAHLDFPSDLPHFPLLPLKFLLAENIKKSPDGMMRMTRSIDTIHVTGKTDAQGDDMVNRLNIEIL